MNYSWSIVKLGLKDELNHEGNLLEDSIVEVQWKRIAEDTDGTLASYVGRTSLSAKNIDQINFTALDDVTSAQVTQWVEDDLGTAGLQKIRKILDNKIERNRQRNISPNWN